MKSRPLMDSHESKVDWLDGFICCITQDIMTNPVMTVDGHTYERSAIEQWFKENRTSPATLLPLHSKQLIPNHNLKKAITDFLKRHPVRNSLHQSSQSIQQLTSSSSSSSANPTVSISMPSYASRSSPRFFQAENSFSPLWNSDEDPIDSIESILQRVQLRSSTSSESSDSIDPQALLLQGARTGNFELLRRALREGADLDFKNAHGGSALFAAISKNQQGVVFWFQQKRADLTLTDAMGRNPLMKVASLGHVHLCKIFYDKLCLNQSCPRGRTPIIYAAINGHLDVIKELELHGGILHRKDREGRNALMYAAINNRKDVAEYLLEKGVRLYEKDRTGKNAIDLAHRQLRDTLETLSEYNRALQLGQFR